MTVAAEPPAGAEPFDVAGPALGGGSDATLAQWTALRTPATGDVLFLGCVATPIPGWIEDMRPSIEARNLAFTISSAQRLVGADIEAKPELGYLALLPPGAPGEPRTPLGVSRTFLGFGARSEVVTCFATCATPHPGAQPPVAPELPARPRTCDASVAGAHLAGEVVPPPAGVFLGATSWAIHHAHETLAWALGLTFCLGAIAVVTRRRPRSRI